jgi:hypothetical protein
MPAEVEPLYIVILAIIIGTLLAIVYSLRILVLLERRVARMDFNIMKFTARRVEEEKNAEIVKSPKKR